jgi:predicted acyltransferase
LIALGLALGFFRLDFANMRYVSVLGLIGVAYLIAGLIVLCSGPRGQAAWAMGIVLGHWAALAYIDVPGVGAGVLTPGGCLNGYIDSHLLPGQLYEGSVFDPAGILCFLPAAATALAGALAGRLLRTQPESPYRNVFVLLCCGLAILSLGFAWSHWCPIIKAVWSSSYVLVACGCALILLAIFYLVIDVWRWRWLGFVFVPIGMNAITIYLALFYVDFHYTSDRIFGGLTRLAGNQFGPVVAAAGVLAVQWAIVYFLYRRGIFLKV